MNKYFYYYLLPILIFLAYQARCDDNSIILPYMEGKIEKGKNYIYCPTFQMAWDDVEKNILHAKPIFSKPSPMADILNSNVYKKENLYPERYYVKSGYLKDNTVELIIRELTAKYGEKKEINRILREHSKPITPLDFLSFAYLQARPRFAHPFYSFKSPLRFESGKDKNISKVESFGISDFKAKDDKGEHEYRQKQVFVIDYLNEDDFIISISAISEVMASEITRKKRDSEGIEVEPVEEIEENPSDEQILIAKIPPGKTLQETWKEVLARFKKQKGENNTKLKYDEIVKIPKIGFDCLREYRELYHNKLKNKGFEILEIEAAIQSIKFNLNEKGADLESFAVIKYAGCAIHYLPPPRRFVLDRPFLIALRQDGKEPYLVLWVENPNIMQKWEPPSEKFTDYFEKGQQEAKAEFSKGVIKRKVASEQDAKNLKAEIYRHLFSIKTEAVEDLKGEELSNFIMGYNDVINEKLCKKHKVDISRKVEDHLKKCLSLNRSASSGDLVALEEMQNPDGSWGTEEQSKVLLTSLAVLAFSSRGETPKSDEFGRPLLKGYKKLIAMNRKYQDSALGEIYPEDVILAFTLSEAYNISQRPILKQSVATASERAFKRKKKDSLWYFMLLRSLPSNDAVSKEKVQKEMALLKNSINDKLKVSRQNSDMNGFVVATLTQLYATQKMSEQKTIEFIEKNALFDWEKTVDPMSRERYYAQTILFMNIRGETWKRWIKDFRIELVKSRKIDPINIKVVYSVKYPEKSVLSKADHQLYSNLMATLLLTAYYRYLPSVEPIKLEKEEGVDLR